MNRCVIVAAGEIHNYGSAISFLRKDDYFIFCDGGLSHAESLCIKPNLIVGDFDSCDSDVLSK